MHRPNPLGFEKKKINLLFTPLFFFFLSSRTFLPFESLDEFSVNTPFFIFFFSHPQSNINLQLETQTGEKEKDRKVYLHMQQNIT